MRNLLVVIVLLMMSVSAAFAQSSQAPESWRPSQSKSGRTYYARKDGVMLVVSVFNDAAISVMYSKSDVTWKWDITDESVRESAGEKFTLSKKGRYYEMRWTKVPPPQADIQSGLGKLRAKYSRFQNHEGVRHFIAYLESLARQ